MTPPVGGPASAGPLFFRFRDAVRQVDRLSFALVVVSMAGMAALVSAQVFFRYALADSIDWAEEVSRLFFVWSMFLAIPHGVRQGIHVGIDILVKALPETTQDALLRVTSALGAVLMVIVFYYALVVTVAGWDELMPTVDVTSAVYYIAVVVATGHSFLHLALLAWGGSRSWEGAQA